MYEERTLKTPHSHNTTGINRYCLKKKTTESEMKTMEGRRRRNTRWTLTEDHFPFLLLFLHYSPGTEDNRKQTPSSTADSTLFYIFSTWGFTGETATSSFVLTTEPSSTQLLIAQVCSTPLLRDGERFTWHPLLCMLPFRLSEDFPSNPPSRNTKKKNGLSVKKQHELQLRNRAVSALTLCLELFYSVLNLRFLYFSQAFYSFTWC